MNDDKDIDCWLYLFLLFYPDNFLLYIFVRFVVYHKDYTYSHVVHRVSGIFGWQCGYCKNTIWRKENGKHSFWRISIVFFVVYCTFQVNYRMYLKGKLKKGKTKKYNFRRRMKCRSREESIRLYLKKCWARANPCNRIAFIMCNDEATSVNSSIKKNHFYNLYLFLSSCFPDLNFNIYYKETVF